ncbi:MAG: quinol:cytochrome C oxidoreductase [Acidobacteriia bacterium]|nr:quinol:cytochrome C oxidoreductase [Terriglobia bacterium]
MNRPGEILSEQRHLGALGERLWRRAALVGVAALAVSVALAAATPGGWHRFFFAYLVAFAYVLSLALGSLYFVILHHLTNAGWSVVVRRIAEAFAGTLPFMAVLALPLLVGIRELYPWASGTAGHLAHGKAVYLSVPFCVARWVVYLGVWTLMARFFVGRSIEQDASGEPSLSVSMKRLSAPAMLALAATLSFAAFDLLMSLDPGWTSTIFGVYYYAGCAVAVYALLPVSAFSLQRAGLLRGSVTVEHYHDLGKLLFGFVVFWAYIAFSQLMLQWYANIPEETHWFVARQNHGWGWVGLVLIFGHFLLPFLALLSRAPKRRPAVLAVAAGWLLVMHLVDLYWLVMPAGSPSDAVPRLVDVTTFIGLAGLLVALAAFVVRGRALVPERDPRLAESLSFENA